MSAEKPRFDHSASSSPQSAGPGHLPEGFSVLAESRRAWLWSSVPPVILLALAIGLRDNRLLPGNPSVIAARPAGVAAPAGLSLRDGVLPLSQTLIVSESGTSGFVFLRGRLEDAVSVRGRAPMSGQIARVLVKPGQKVAVNDRVIEMAAGSPPRRASRAERLQNSAESAQVAAVSQQEALQTRLQAEHQRLLESQERVKAAQERLASAKLVVEKLQRGESVAPGDVRPSRPQERVNRSQHKAAASQELQAAQRRSLLAAEKARQQATRAAEAARAAARAVAAAEEDVKRRGQKVEELRLASEKVQKLFNSGAAKASDVDAARAGLESAQDDAQAAAERLTAARQDAGRLAQAEKEARGSAQEATRSASQSLEKLQLFSESSEKEQPAAAPEPAPANQGSSLTMEQAVAMVRTAIEESDAAAEDARRIKTSVDAYERQVNQTKNKLDTSAEQLEAAQQRVLDETIQRNLSVVRAPADGTVLSVASVASLVSAGDIIIQVGRSGVLQVQLADASGAWRSLKTGMQLTGRIETPPPAPVQAGTAKAGAAAAAPTGADAPAPGAAVSLRVTEIEEPKPGSKQAIITAVVEDSQSNTAGAGSAPATGTPAGRPRLHQGMVLVCSVVKPGEWRAILIPAASVIPSGGGTGTVAVLTGQSGADSVQGDSLPPHRIEWRQVRLGAADGARQEVVSGLSSGERIALRPTELMAYAKSTGAREIRLETRV